MSGHGHDADEAHEEDRPRPLTEFDCPSCTAHNPCEPLKDKEEVLCLFCGLSFEVRLSPGGKLRLRET